MNDELKPCPFCGAPAEFCENPHGYHGTGSWAVYCSKGPANVCGDRWTKAEAAEAWNRRADSIPIPEKCACCGRPAPGASPHIRISAEKREVLFYCEGCLPEFNGVYVLPVQED